MKRNEMKEQARSAKRQCIAASNKPVIRIPLTKHWSTVITTNGDRFYFHSSRLKSFWQLPKDLKDEELAKADEAVSELKSIIIIITGIVRGYNLDRFVWNAEKKEQILKQVKETIGEISEDQSKQDTGEVTENNGDSSTKEDSDLIKSVGTSSVRDENKRQWEMNGLQIGYESSSASDEEPVRIENERDSYINRNNSPSSSPEKERSSDEFGLDISDLEELDDEENLTIGKFDNKEGFPENKTDHLALEFISLLERKSIDPFSAYELEKEKFLLDPEYLAIKPETAEILFNYWCSKKASKNSDMASKVEHPKGNEEENEKDASDDLKLYIEWMKSLVQVPKYYFELRRKFRRSDITKKTRPDEELIKRIFKEYHEVLKQNLGKERTFERLEKKMRASM